MNIKNLDDMEDLEEDDTTYTVIAYWEEATDRYGDRTHRSRLTENHYDTAEQATNAGVQAQVDDADIVRIFRGRDVEEEICNWKDINDRVKAGREDKAREKRARQQREIDEANAQQKATTEKYERLQLQKLLEKYGPEGVDIP
jgi:hypothetical protein